MQPVDIFCMYFFLKEFQIQLDFDIPNIDILLISWIGQKVFEVKATVSLCTSYFNLFITNTLIFQSLLSPVRLDTMRLTVNSIANEFIEQFTVSSSSSV